MCRYTDIKRRNVWTKLPLPFSPRLNVGADKSRTGYVGDVELVKLRGNVWTDPLLSCLPAVWVLTGAGQNLRSSSIHKEGRAAGLSSKSIYSGSGALPIKNSAGVAPSEAFLWVPGTL